jgi:hypothetical protein
MRGQQTQRGEFKKVDLQGKTIEKWCEEQCIIRGETGKWEYETWRKFFFDIYGDEYFVVNDEVYQILEVEDLYYHCYYVHVGKQDDDTYSFFATYYNGVTDLKECLEDGLDTINE